MDQKYGHKNNGKEIPGKFGKYKQDRYGKILRSVNEKRYSWTPFF